MTKESEERHKMQQASLAGEAANELAEKAPLIARFRQLCMAKGIPIEDNAFSYIPQIGVIAASPGLVTRLHPDVSTDKDGLYDFQGLSAAYTKQLFAPGYLYGEQFMLMAHPYFRRGFYPGAAFPPRFVDLFWRLETPAIQKSIALDRDRVRINVDNSMYMEFDTWYGPKFKRDIHSIPDDVVKLAPPGDLQPFDISFLFNDVCATDIKWSSQGRIKSFYAEEFNTENITVRIDGGKYHPARYIHAEFDLDRGEFRHFDGSLHFYSPEDYQARRYSDFHYNAKNRRLIKSRSLKLFRMDGRIPPDDWIEFVSHYFERNPLIFEYFEGSLPRHTAEMIDILRKRDG